VAKNFPESLRYMSIWYIIITVIVFLAIPNFPKDKNNEEK